MDTKRRVEILETSLSRQLGWIAAADAKTGFIFAIATAMVGLLASAAPAYGSWTALGVTLAIVATAGLLGAIAAVLVAVFPRTKGPKPSLVFFGGISSRNIDGYRKDMTELTEEAYEADLIEQSYINARIAAVKYRWVRVASVLLAASLVPWILAAYVLFRDK